MCGEALVPLAYSPRLLQPRCCGRASAAACAALPLLARVLDFELLRFKQRDEVEACLKLWAEEAPFDAVALRDQRLRQNHGQRYDFRTNLADWDYQQVIKGHK